MPLKFYFKGNNFQPNFDSNQGSENFYLKIKILFHLKKNEKIYFTFVLAGSINSP